MKCYTFRYKYTDYVRVPDGIMDTRFSHTEVSVREFSVVVPSDRDRDIAETYCRTYGGNSRDKAFEIISICEMDIHAIIPSPMTRL